MVGRRVVGVFGLVLATTFLIAVAGCNGDGKTPAPAAPRARHRPAPRESTLALWRLAPDGAKAGIVIAAGSLPPIAAALRHIRTTLVDSGAGDLVASFDENTGDLLGYADAAKPRSSGIDLGSSAAVFYAEETGEGFVLPLVDRRAFRATNGAVVEKRDGVTIDRIGRLRCREARKHYVCAQHLSTLLSMGHTPNNELARRRAASELEPGDVEVINIADDVEEQPLGMDGYVASFEIGKGRIRGVIRTRATAMPLALEPAPHTLLDAFAAQPVAAALHFGFPAGLVAMAPNAEVQALAPALTGEVLVLGPSARPGRLDILVGLTDPAPARKLLESTCALLGNRFGSGFAYRDGRCAGRVPLETDEPSELGIAFEVGADRLTVEAQFPVAPDAHQPADPPERTALSREVLGSRHAVAIWAEGLSMLPFLWLTPDLAPKLPGLEPNVRAFLMLAADVHELGVWVQQKGKLVEGRIVLDTFHEDGAEIYRRYRAAVRRGVGGDIAGARRDLEALAAANPDSRVARQLAVGAGALPLFGILAGAIPAFIDKLDESRTDD